MTCDVRRVKNHTSYVTRLYNNLINIIQIPAVAVVVEAAAHDEFVGDADADVMHGQAGFVGIGLHGHSGHAHILCTGFGQYLVQMDVGSASIDDVFEDDDPLSAHVLVETDEAIDFAGGFSATIRGELYAGDSAFDVELLDEIDGEEDSSVQCNQQNGVVVVVFFIDFGG